MPYILLALVATAVVNAEPQAMPRVRSSHPYIRAIIEEAQVRSETFRGLVHAIEETNGIVYVEEGECQHGVHACLTQVITLAGEYRILHALVDARKEDWEVMSNIGHELQHALEVLRQPGVKTDQQMFYTFYKQGANAERVETEDAVRAGEAIRHELETFARHKATKGAPR